MYSQSKLYGWQRARGHKAHDEHEGRNWTPGIFLMALGCRKQYSWIAMGTSMKKGVQAKLLES